MSSPPDLPKQMRAWLWDKIPTTLSSAINLSTTAPLPATPSSLKPDQTLVRVHYVSLNPVDFKVPEVAGRLLRYFTPGIPCLDYCGTVVATGSSRSDLKPGQLVFGMTDVPKFGSLADYVIAPREGCVAVPDGVEARDAATLGVAAKTAWQCIEKMPKKEDGGGKIFINGGSGGVGTFGIQFAKARGAYVVTTCSARNVELCKSLGADEVIDYTKGDVVGSLVKSARVNGEFDMVVDNVGSTPLYWKSHDYTQKSASFVSIAGDMSLASIATLMQIFLWPGVLGGGKRKFENVFGKAEAQGYTEIAALVKAGKVKSVIEQVYDMEEAPRAFERLKTGRVAGKLVVKVL